MAAASSCGDCALRMAAITHASAVRRTLHLSAAAEGSAIDLAAGKG